MLSVNQQYNVSYMIWSADETPACPERSSATKYRSVSSACRDRKFGVWSHTKATNASTVCIFGCCPIGLPSSVTCVLYSRFVRRRYELRLADSGTLVGSRDRSARLLCRARRVRRHGTDSETFAKKDLKVISSAASSSEDSA